MNYPSMKHQFVRCRECLQPMDAIFSKTIRHTCAECGGKALVEGSDEVLVQRRKDDREAPPL